MRIVFVTQQVDPEHPVLGATVAKIRALAERCEGVAVLADGIVEGALPENVRVHAFRSGTRAGRGAKFELALARELARRPRPAAVVAHMCPIYAVLAAPLARPLGVRVILWFTHWQRSRLLVRAERMSNAVATVFRSSAPLESAKVVGIGHGIDTESFPCQAVRDDARAGELKTVALGRYSFSKGLDVVVRGVAEARARGLAVRLHCHGTIENEVEQSDFEALEHLVHDLGLEDAVELGGPVQRSEVPMLLGSVDALVNNTRGGSADKVVYEAALSCRPVVVSNAHFDELLESVEPDLRFRPDEPSSLAAALERLAALDPVDRAAIGRRLREEAAARHSVGAWADAMLDLCRGR